ncbi:MAG: hypothetical protein E7260_06865 [Lachnospiraceae bacterium]|nr:hypothetical protein [Lachnospiraceae bacterium]
MKKKMAVMIGITMILIIAGCNRGDARPTYGPSAGKEETGNKPGVTRAATLPPTQTPVPTETPTPEPTATFTPTPMPSPTATPIPSPTETPAPTPTPEPTATEAPQATFTPTPTPTPAYTYKELDKTTMWATTNVYMRSLPAKDGEVLDLVRKGNKVTVTGQCNETNWYVVAYNGQNGYVCNDYLTKTAPATPTPTPRPTATPTPTPREIAFNGDAVLNIRMVGDALIHGNVYKQCKKSDGTYNADILYKHVKDVIAEADIAILNQETILVEDEDDYSTYPQFGSPYAIGQAAVDAGFDVIAHATNHTLDKRLAGVRQTLAFWKDKPVTVLGIHETKEESDIDYVSCEGITISFVNYTYGLNGLDKYMEDETYIVDLLSDKNIEKTVAEAKATSDLMIAVLHVGTEYVYTPSSYAIKQVDRFIDAGADIVLCAHPHVVETYGMRTTSKGNQALVYYSLGNFVSSQNKIPRMIGGMADITLGITKDAEDVTIELLDYTMTPVVTHIASGDKITTYFLSDYTEALCAKHKYFQEESLKLDDLYRLYDEMVTEADHLISREWDEKIYID